MKANRMFNVLRILLILLATAFCFSPARTEPAPAAFVTAINLKGADLDEGTAIRRGAEELRPRLLMPLFAGDVVFLRDPGSRIVLEGETGEETEITGAVARFEVKGGGTADSGFWGMLGVVADAVSGDEDEVAPDNMMSRDTDDVIDVPMAARAGNQLVRDGGPVWLAWQGGKAPYRVRIAAGEAATMQDNITEKEVSFDLPDTASRRIKITIEDAGGRRATVMFRLVGKRPEPPFAVTHDADESGATRLAYAAWLTGVDDGIWSAEAARLLREDKQRNPAAELLLRRIADGWKTGN
jgi:hypothetical protein